MSKFNLERVRNFSRIVKINSNPLSIGRLILTSGKSRVALANSM
jgi:hypothetical protein